MLKISSKKIKQVIIRIQDNAIDWSTTKVSRGELLLGLLSFFFCILVMIIYYAPMPLTQPRFRLLLCRTLLSNKEGQELTRASAHCLHP